MSRTLNLVTNAFNSKIFKPVKLSGNERINELFRYTLIVKTPDSSGLEFFKQFGTDNTANVDLTAWIRQNISVGVEINFNGVLGNDTRWISGQITSARYLYQQRKSHFYAIEISPFLSFSNLHSDYKIFQDKNVIEILDEILIPYLGSVEKRLDESRYPKRVYQTQFGETDFAFFERLCSEWGINYFFKHDDSGHTLVLSDEARRHQTMPNRAYQNIDYYPPDAFVTDKQEVISDISLIASAVSGAFSSKDYDYQQPGATIADTVDNIQPYPESARAASKDKKDKVTEVALKGHQIYEYSADITQAQQSIKNTSENSEITANTQNKSAQSTATQSSNPYGEEHNIRGNWNLERIQQHHFTAVATGHVRALSCGHTFKLNKHPNSLANIDWNVVGTELLILDMREESHRKENGLSSLLSAGAGETNISSVFLEQIKQSGQALLDKVLGEGEQSWQIDCKAELIPANIAVRPAKKDKPKGTLQNALVVGEESVHTDELGRIKVQFYWDRYGQKNEHSSCWVRVNEPWAGGQMGAVFTPRVGQEVLIDYINNDPDLPVCMGKVNNSNNEPNWKLTENKELSGFRSREFPSGNSSSGRSNHLIFDDTAGKIQTQLKSDHAHSQLSLGDITRIEDNAGKKDARGQGFELRTDDWGAARAAKGLYLSTYARDAAESSTMDAEEAKDLIDQAKQLVKQLSQFAAQHKAEPLSGEKPLEALAKVVTTVTDKESKGSEDSPKGFEENVLVGAGEAGIALVTQNETHQYSMKQHTISTGEDLNVTVAKSWLGSIMNKLSFFVYQGIKIFSGKGKVQIQAQTNELELLAQKVAQLISTQDWVEVVGKKGVFIKGGNSYIKISSEGIEHGTTGQFVAYASNHSLVGPRSVSYDFPDNPSEAFDHRFVIKNEETGEILPNYPYKIKREDGSYEKGFTNKEGLTHMVFSSKEEKIELELGDSEE